MNEVLKFSTNIPELVTFKYNDFREGKGEYGAWYKYTVVNKGVDKTVFAKEGLHQKLQSLQPIEGKELEITLAEEDNRKRWKIYFRGEEVAVGYQDTKSYSKPQEGAKMEATIELEKMRAWAVKVQGRLNAIESRLKPIEEKLFPETGELQKDGVHMTREDLEQIAYFGADRLLVSNLTIRQPTLPRGKEEYETPSN